MTIKYTEDHEWVRPEKDNLYTIGITDYAQEQLGEVVHVELPDPGATVAQGEETAVVESVKAAGDVKSPIGGEVRETNPALADRPELVNESPENEGWLYRLHAQDAKQLDALMDTDAYQNLLKTLA